MKQDLKKLIESQKDISDIILSKTSLDDYINKIIEFATIIPYYNDTLMKGFIAYYSNDVLKKNAYLTLIAVHEGYHGEGIGKLLLQTSIADLIHRNFLNYKLEVFKNNLKAINLYKKFGFLVEEDLGDAYLMNLILK